MELYVSYPGPVDRDIDLAIDELVGEKAHSSGFNVATGRRDLEYEVRYKMGKVLLMLLNGKAVKRRPLTVSDKLPSLF